MRLLKRYIPLLPYIVYLIGEIAWIIAVIEGMVAAPIIIAHFVLRIVRHHR